MIISNVYINEYIQNRIVMNRVIERSKCIGHFCFDAHVPVAPPIGLPLQVL